MYGFEPTNVSRDGNGRACKCRASLWCRVDSPAPNLEIFQTQPCLTVGRRFLVVFTEELVPGAVDCDTQRRAAAAAQE
jgi:hypothetical protein